jgi:molecular chaperone GrpE
MKGSKKTARKDLEPDAQEQPDISVDTGTTGGQDEATEEGDSTGTTSETPSRESLLEERLLRLQADFENFRKRTLREKEELYRRANEEFILELLPVLDHLGLAFAAAGDAAMDHPVVKGFALVGEQLQQVLKKFGLTEIEIKDQSFDPNLHEAIQHLPSDTVPEDGLVACVRAGYTLGSRLLRAAQVVVSSGPQDAGSSNS